MLAQALAGVVLATMSFTAPDGRAATGSWVPVERNAAASLPAVLLVPEPGAKADAWLPIARQIRDAGLHALVIEPRALEKKHAFGVGALDVTGALDWLRHKKGVDASRILVVGAGDGAMVALAGSCLDTEIAGLAMISPALDGERLDDATAVANWGKRPFFVAVSKGDKRAARSALVLDGNAKGAKKIHISPGSRKGVELVTADEDTRAALLDWLTATTEPRSP